MSVPSLPESAYRILVIDDRLEIRRQVQYALSGLYGISVVEADDGASGLEALRRWAIDLVLLDLQLPDLHGEEVLRRIKSDPEIRQIPVLILTAGETTDDIIPRLLLAGADEYIRKPVDSVDLRQRISSRIALAQLRNVRREVARRLRHDIADPLNVVIFAADLLKGVSEPAQIEKRSQEVVVAASKVMTMVDQLITELGQ